MSRTRKNRESREKYPDLPQLRQGDDPLAWLLSLKGDQFNLWLSRSVSGESCAPFPGSRDKGLATMLIEVFEKASQRDRSFQVSRVRPAIKDLLRSWRPPEGKENEAFSDLYEYFLLADKFGCGENEIVRLLGPGNTRVERSGGKVTPRKLNMVIGCGLNTLASLPGNSGAEHVFMEYFDDPQFTATSFSGLFKGYPDRRTADYFYRAYLISKGPNAPKSLMRNILNVAIRKIGSFKLVADFVLDIILHAYKLTAGSHLSSNKKNTMVEFFTVLEESLSELGFTLHFSHVDRKIELWRRGVPNTYEVRNVPKWFVLANTPKRTRRTEARVDELMAEELLETVA